MRLDDLQARLRRAHAELDFRGRLSVTFRQQPDAYCSILHWLPVGSGEDCREVGYGNVDDCLAALDGYVAREKKTAP